MAIKTAIVVMSAVALLVGVPATGSDKKPLTFQITVMAEIEDTNVAKAGFHTHHSGSTVFKGSNGANLTVLYGDFKDADESKRFLEWNIQRAFKVLSQETKTEASRKPMEYRAELIPEWDHSSIEVMWVVGDTTRWILARYRDDALQLEKYYKRSLSQRR
jgi:hypothetical protein